MNELGWFLTAFAAMGISMWIVAMLVFQSARAYEAWKRRREYYLSAGWRPWREGQWRR